MHLIKFIYLKQSNGLQCGWRLQVVCKIKLETENVACIHNILYFAPLRYGTKKPYHKSHSSIMEKFNNGLNNKMKNKREHEICVCVCVCAIW